MRRVLVAVFALGLVMAACGNDTPTEYNADSEKNFVESCTDQTGEEDVCQCAYDGFVRDIPFDRFQRIDQRLQDDPEGNLPDDFIEIYTDCVVEFGGGSAGTTPVIPTTTTTTSIPTPPRRPAGRDRTDRRHGAVTDTAAPPRPRSHGGPTSGRSSTTRSSTPASAPAAPAASSPAPTTSSATTTSPGGYKPFHLEDELGPTDCGHGQKGCTCCTRACPRFRTWEADANEHLFARDREDDEMSGIYQDIMLTRAVDDMVHEMGQDGGLVSAHAHLGAGPGLHRRRPHLVPRGRRHALEGHPRRGRHQGGGARVRRQPLHVLGQHPGARRGPRAGLLEAGPGRHELPVVGAAGHVAPQDRQDRASPSSSTSACSARKTFDDAIFEELFEAKYGLKKEDMVKMNIKGVFQIWMHNGDYHEVNLKECHAWTREGCKTAPTSPPSTPTSPPAASARTTTGPSPSSAPTSVARSSAG